MENTRGRQDFEQPRGLLRLDLGHGWTVQELHDFLQSLRYAHASISLALQENHLEAPYGRRLLYPEWEGSVLFSGYERRGYFAAPPQNRFSGSYNELFAEYYQWHRATTLNRFWPNDDLLLHTITIGSPGLAEIIGNLSPLKFIKDLILICRDWRSERDRHTLENQLLQTRLLQEQLGIMRETGFSDEQIKEFVSNHIQMPLNELRPYQDRGQVIGAATKALECPAPYNDKVISFPTYYAA